MLQGLIGRKIDQTQKFLENGKRVPVTEISVSDNSVMQVKTLEKDKYVALQLGFGNRKNPNRPMVGHSRKAGFNNSPEYIREVRLENESGMPKTGDSLSVDSVFKAGDIVKVTGTSKGKGFAGVVKRHGFRGGPKTHGQSDRLRAPGSIGQTTTPGRVYKGKRMAGRMGAEIVTIADLTVLDVDVKEKKLYVTGLVPGHKKSLVFITKTGESKKFVPLLKVAEEAVAEEAGAETVEEVKTELTEAPVEEVKEEVATEEKAEVKEENKEEAK